MYKCLQITSCPLKMALYLWHYINQYGIIFILLLFIFFVYSRIVKGSECPEYSYEVVHSYPHDRLAFTQGLLYYNGYLYESTGLNSNSSIRQVELEKGKVIKLLELPDSIFCEGLTLADDKLIQLTLDSGFGFVYDALEFRRVNKFPYQHDGWGITFDGDNIITSDGTSMLRFFNPSSFKEIDSLKVHCGDSLIENINELEYVKGEIFANIWQTDLIARISPKTGEVVGWIYMDSLLSMDDVNNRGLEALNVLPEEYRNEKQACLNGIAYDAKGDRLFVTGKLWPKVFQIKLKPKMKTAVLGKD